MQSRLKSARVTCNFLIAMFREMKFFAAPLSPFLLIFAIFAEDYISTCLASDGILKLDSCYTRSGAVLTTKSNEFVPEDNNLRGAQLTIKRHQNLAPQSKSRCRKKSSLLSLLPSESSVSSSSRLSEAIRLRCRMQRMASTRLSQCPMMKAESEIH